MKTKAVYRRFCVLFILLISLSLGAQAQRGRHYYGGGGYYYPGQRFYSLPSAFLSLSFGGYPYYYSGGMFYRPYGSYYELAAPPFGISVGVLPRGYWSLRFGGYPYFYYNGIFYRPSNSQYEVVQAPVGAEVPSIPRDARATVIDGEKYYEYYGTYYKDVVKPNGELWYRVEGKHGVLNTDKNPTAQNNQPSPTPQPRQQAPAVQDSKPPIGEVFDRLPDDYKTVVINSKKYFVSSNNVYYEEVIDGTQVRYKVAGK